MSATETLHVAAERAPFVMLPRWLLHGEVSDGAKLLYCMLHDLVAGREGPTRPVTRGQLGEACGVSVDTVDRRLGELIRVGAVEKQAQFEIHQGQLANVYYVRLSPPAATLRPPVENSHTPGRNGAAPPPQPCPEPGRVSAAPLEEQEKELPPQPPRLAGGPDGQVPGGGVGRRLEGTNLRALGANPRAEATAAQAEQAQLKAARRAAEIEAEVAARRAEAEVAAAERSRAEAEAASVSAALDDELLHRLLPRCREGLPGPLACSAAGLTRAAVTWCRAARVEWPGDLAVAVRRSLEGPPPGPDGSASRLPLPPAPPGASPLLDRVRAWIDLQK